MRRAVVLGIIVVGGLTLAAFGLSAQQGAPQAGREGGQGRGGGRGPGFPPISAPEKVANDLYMIPGQGGNTAAFITANGVVLVDTKLANNGQGILDQLKTVTNKPVTHIINTHTHGDHTGSNDFFPASVEIVTQENTAENMKKMPAFQEESKKHGLPDRTFKDKMTLLRGNDAIDLYYYGPAHTNGDAFVVFRNLRVMHAGDAFATKGQPLIDANNGGSGVAYPQTIAKAAGSMKNVAGIKNVDIVITGHSTVMKWQDFVDYGEFNRLFLEHARASLAAGKTAEQAMADFKLPEKFKDYNIAGGRGGPGGNFNVIFTELQKK
jgi:glyoxylase-like metal-dependent hydrolase (beta-lactamase superfamily II)